MKRSSLYRALRGFTLIELLTVIAIIGILAAILIPVVGAVREQAKVAQCAVHLRDLGAAAHLYAAERGDMLPPHIRAPGDVPTTEWGSAIGPDAHGVIGFLLAPEKGGARIAGWTGDYLDSAHPLMCPATREELFADPAYKRPDEINASNPIRRAGYMWIYRVDQGRERRDNTNLAVSNLNRPYVFDFPPPGTSVLSSVFTKNPHQNRVNVLHIGGHVTSFSTDEILSVPPDPGGNTLFDYFTFRKTGISQ